MLRPSSDITETYVRNPLTNLPEYMSWLRKIAVRFPIMFRIHFLKRLGAYDTGLVLEGCEASAVKWLSRYEKGYTGVAGRGILRRSWKYGLIER